MQGSQHPTNPYCRQTQTHTQLTQQLLRGIFASDHIASHKIRRTELTQQMLIFNQQKAESLASVALYE